MEGQRELKAIQLVQKSELMTICKLGETLCELIGTKMQLSQTLKKLLKIASDAPSLKMDDQIADLSQMVAGMDKEIAEHEAQEKALKEEMNEKEALLKMGGMLADLMGRRS